MFSNGIIKPVCPLCKSEMVVRCLHSARNLSSQDDFAEEKLLIAGAVLIQTQLLSISDPMAKESLDALDKLVAACNANKVSRQNKDTWVWTCKCSEETLFAIQRRQYTDIV